MRKSKGQALLEIALVMPVIIIVFCGMIDFGRILEISTHLNMVSQDAVRLAGLGRSDSDIEQFVQNDSYLSDKSSIEVTIDPSGTRKSGDYVTVTISYPVKYITPLANIFLSSAFVVNTKSTIRVE